MTETDFIHARFDRQILLPHMSIDTQTKLWQSKVLVIGAGGLGCTVIQHLAAAGIGHITVVDGDTIAESNLHRQILFTSDDIGQPKASTACVKVKRIHHRTSVVPVDQFADEALLQSVIPNHHIVLDCTDQFAIRYTIDYLCHQYQRPWVYAALHLYQGQVAVFRTHSQAPGICDLFENPPVQGQYQRCDTVGTMASICGTIGALQALEAIKYLIQLPGLLDGVILTLNLLDYQLYRTAITKIRIPKAINSTPRSHDELDIETFLEIAKQPNALLIDVRNKGEKPLISKLPHINIPLSQLAQEAKYLDPSKKILLFCHAGIRSREALDLLKDEFNFTQAYHLRGGLIKWDKSYYND